MRGRIDSMNCDLKAQAGLLDVTYRVNLHLLLALRNVFRDAYAWAASRLVCRCIGFRGILGLLPLPHAATW